MSNYGLQQLFEESVSAVTATNSVQLGVERWQDGRKYRYMYNGSTSTAATKMGVVYSGNSGYTMTISNVAGQAGLAGVVYNAEIGPANYGWIAVQGPVPVAVVATAISQGMGLVHQGTNGYFTANTGATGTTGRVVAYAVGDSGVTSTAGTALAFINC